MIKAVGKRLVVKALEEEKDEKKVIIQVSTNRPFKAEVIAIGSQVDENVLEGHVVILPPQIGTPVEIEGEKYLSIYEDQILAIEEK